MSDSKTQRNGSSFVNPWSSGFSLRQSAEAILKGPLTRSTPFKVDVEPVKTVECDLEVYESEEAKEGVCATWLGHAVCDLILEMIIFTLLIPSDPTMSSRDSSSKYLVTFESYSTQSSLRGHHLQLGLDLGDGWLRLVNLTNYRKSTS